METAKGLLIELFGSVLSRFWIAGARTYWLYLLAAIAIALLIWLWQRRANGTIKTGLNDLTGYLFPSRVWLHRSALADYRFFLVNSMLMLVLLLPLSGAANGWLQDLAATLLQWLPAATASDTNAGGIAWPWLVLVALTSLAIMDFTIFACHTAMHRVPVLWEFHKVHHSAEVLVPLTLYRMHPVDLLLTAFAVSFTLSLVAGLLILALPVLGLDANNLPMFKIMGLNGFLFCFYLFGYNLRHSHIWLAYPVWLSRILMSPAQHHIHHSCEERHLDKNMGLVFALWDWAAGSLYVPKGREEFALGLVDGEAAEYHGVMALYYLPFKKSFKILQTRFSGRKH
jgi:sterol desaturase/sphingolipid hydroxylase (fatty acid hydroxylase superfamily)